MRGWLVCVCVRREPAVSDGRSGLQSEGFHASGSILVPALPGQEQSRQHDATSAQQLLEELQVGAVVGISGHGKPPPPNINTKFAPKNIYKNRNTDRSRCSPVGHCTVCTLAHLVKYCGSRGNSNRSPHLKALLSCAAAAAAAAAGHAGGLSSTRETVKHHCYMCGSQAPPPPLPPGQGVAAGSTNRQTTGVYGCAAPSNQEVAPWCPRRACAQPSVCSPDRWTPLT